MIVDAVIVAAGSSARFGEDKLSVQLLGRPVLQWSIAAFASADTTGRVVVVAAADRQEWVRELIARERWGREVAVVEGGLRRRDSVESGLRASTTRYVAIHDGARPLVTARTIDNVVEAAEGQAGAVATVPVTDTIKLVRGSAVEHLDRRLLRAAQTPQVVLRQAWLDAAGMSDDDETDDVAMLDRLGLSCVIAEGDPGNIKITLPWDITTAEAILRHREVQR